VRVPRDDRRRALLLEQHFGMGVEVMPDGDKLRQMRLQNVFDHRFLGTVRSIRPKAQTMMNVMHM
jgi:hypothetical protein